MPYLFSRQDAAPAAPSPGGIAGAANSVKNTFSSWDGCMSKTYCKWPVIVAIVVVSLILLSILFCFARCLCCGAECACCCFRCCAGCCGSKNKKHKHLDSVPPTPYRGQAPAQPWHQQYQSTPAPIYRAAPVSAPQFATFDASRGKPINEDALPAMPSWETAQSRKVEVTEEPEQHEMDKIDPRNNYDIPTKPTLPLIPSPSPTRPGDGAPFFEQSSYLGSSTSFNRQPEYGQPHADSHSGYRGAAPSPAPGGYGGQHHGSSQQVDRYDDRYDQYRDGPVSPLYSQNTGSTYEPPSRHYGGGGQQQGQSPYGQYSLPHPQSSAPYGGGHSDRRPVNGSWRDV